MKPDIRAVQNALIAFEQVPLYGQVIRSGETGVGPETALAHLVRVFRVLAVLQRHGIAICVTAKRPKKSAIPKLASISNGGEAPLAGAAAGHNEASLCIPGALGDDVDHAVDGIAAPQRGARAADHFDAVDVFDDGILHVPEHASKQRVVEAAPIHEDL